MPYDLVSEVAQGDICPMHFIRGKSCSLSVPHFRGPTSSRSPSVLHQVPCLKKGSVRDFVDMLQNRHRAYFQVQIDAYESQSPRGL